MVLLINSNGIILSKFETGCMLSSKLNTIIPPPPTPNKNKNTKAIVTVFYPKHQMFAKVILNVQNSYFCEIWKRL